MGLKHVERWLRNRQRYVGAAKSVRAASRLGAIVLGGRCSNALGGQAKFARWFFDAVSPRLHQVRIETLRLFGI
jgi:hypothetical protein